MTELVKTSSALIEGISNDVLVFACLPIIIIVGVMIWYKMFSPNRVIHPSQLNHVQATRERVMEGRNEGEQEQEQRRSNHRNDDDRCPICIDHLRFGVETNCGHVFCCNCLILYWEHGSWTAAMNCPVCRQEVRVILTAFTHEEDIAEEATQHSDKIRTYNRRFSGEPRPIMDYILDFPVLVRHMFRNFFSVSGLVFMLRLRIVVYLLIVVIYVLSPLDIIPEAVMGVLGFVDDFAIACVILLYLTILFRQSLAN